LGSKNHEGNELRAIVNWLNGANFQGGIIDFSNTLHRYNFMLENGLSEATARKKILEISDGWLNAHHHILAALKMPYEIISWDRWLSHEKFSNYERKFQEAFNVQMEFRAAILQDVETYFSRRFGIKLQDAEPEAIKLSVAFLIEELAAHSILYEDYPCAVVYPGRQQESFRIVRAGGVRDVPIGMQNSFHTRLTLHNLQVAVPLKINDNVYSINFIKDAI
jgi:tRNA-dependent cyclodipeptide synthase